LVDFICTTLGLYHLYSKSTETKESAHLTCTW